MEEAEGTEEEEAGSRTISPAAEEDEEEEEPAPAPLRATDDCGRAFAIPRLLE